MQGDQPSNRCRSGQDLGRHEEVQRLAQHGAAGQAKPGRDLGPDLHDRTKHLVSVSKLHVQKA